MNIYHSKGDKVVIAFIYTFLLVCLLIVLYPLIYVLSASFSSPSAVISGRVWLFPVEPTLIGYKAVFKNSQIVTGFANSFYYLIVGTAINLVMTVLAAYPLSRKELFGRNAIMRMLVFTMYFSGGLVPTFILIKNLGLYNTRWAMMIPNAMAVWNVIITRTYFQNTIPNELRESSQLDGCSDIYFVLRIVLPLSAPIMAVMALYYGIGHWNAWFNALIYLKSATLYPLQIILRNILISNIVDPTMMQDFDTMQRLSGLTDLLKYSLIVVASVPVLCLYPFVQKYFVKGVMVGSIKG